MFKITWIPVPITEAPVGLSREFIIVSTLHSIFSARMPHSSIPFLSHARICTIPAYLFYSRKHIPILLELLLRPQDHPYPTLWRSIFTEDFLYLAFGMYS